MKKLTFSGAIITLMALFAIVFMIAAGIHIYQLTVDGAINWRY